MSVSYAYASGCSVLVVLAHCPGPVLVALVLIVSMIVRVGCLGAKRLVAFFTAWHVSVLSVLILVLASCNSHQ